LIYFVFAIFNKKEVVKKKVSWLWNYIPFGTTKKFM
jgi:5'(3')-deoxyribonucleotidase